MFNKHIVLGGNSSHSHYHKTDITEKRAPTDESVRILQEMEKKTLDRITDGFLVQGNELEVLALEFMPTNFGERQLYYAFKLNGRRYQGKIDGQDRLMASGAGGEAVEKILKDLGRNIAHQLIQNFGKSDVTRWVRK